MALSFISVLALHSTATAADLLHQPVRPVTQDELEIVGAPYGWAAGLSGTVGVGALPSVEIGQSFSDILQDLNFAAFVAAEIDYRRFIGFTDLQGVSLSASAPTPFGIVADRVKLRTEQVSWIVAGGYRVIDADRGMLDALAGGRLWSVSNRVTLKGSPINRTFENTETWVDPVVGLKAEVKAASSLALVGWGFVGGFGVASDITWDVLGGVG